MSILSIDIGGTFIKYALMDQDAAILSRGKIPTPQKGRTELVEAIGRLYDDMPDVEGIAVQIFNLQTILDSERIAIGGGISAQPVLIEYIRRHLNQLYSDCPYRIPRAEIVTCKFQNDANLYGAMQCYLENVRM